MPRPARSQREPDTTFVERIREHVERDDVTGARRVLADALREGASELGLENWSKILAPARVLNRHPASGTDLRDDIRWLEEHARDYRKQWVAVLSGELFAHARTYEDLHAKLTEMASRATPLVHFVE